jgi:hypothetical protein
VTAGIIFNEIENTSIGFVSEIHPNIVYYLPALARRKTVQAGDVTAMFSKIHFNVRKKRCP